MQSLGTLTAADLRKPVQRVRQKFEVYVDGFWVDLTGYVPGLPTPGIVDTTLVVAGISHGHSIDKLTLETPLPTGAVHWVSPTGLADWDDAESEEPLDGELCCSLTTANASAQAGDTIYLRGGAYDTYIRPAASGTSGARISYIAYTQGTPVFTVTSTTWRYAIQFSGTSWILVDGITSLNSLDFYYMSNGACYNEIRNCAFDRSTYLYSQALICNNMTGTLGVPGSNHNWVHYNTFSRYGHVTAGGSDEGTVRIGAGYNDPSSYNTFEDNTFFYGAHDAFDIGGYYNVFRNNFVHNESAWFEWAVLTTAVGNGQGSKTLVVTDASLLPAAGHKLQVGTLATNVAVIESIDLPTSTVTFVLPLSWQDGDNVRHADRNYPANFYYGNRNIILTCYGSGVSSANYTLLEGNRIGYAGTPPDDDGAMGIENAGRYTLARFNDLYGNGGSGFYFKSQASYTVKSGSHGRVYNNTIYANGFGDPSIGTGFKYGVCAPGGWLPEHNWWPEDCVVKNNIVYGNRAEKRIGDQAEVAYEHNFNGDPFFVDPTIADPTSLTQPNLELQAGSPCIGTGTHLTQANAAGVASTALIVDDARYFHDGSWGSALTWGITQFPDWIAIGSVATVVEIETIDYATNTITLAAPMTWADNAPVWLYRKSDGVRVLYGAGPEYGAHPYAS